MMFNNMFSLVKLFLYSEDILILCNCSLLKVDRKGVLSDALENCYIELGLLPLCCSRPISLNVLSTE